MKSNDLSTIGTATRRRRGGIVVTLVLLFASLLGGQAILATSASAVGTGRIIASPCLNLRTSPATSASVLTCVPYNTSVTIDCTATGTWITGPYGPTSLWDHIRYGGGSGFVTDAYVYTGTNNPVAGTCGSAPPPVLGRTVGQKASSNLGVAGQCTWGAYEQWHAATGYYPYFSGNAKDWKSSAAAHGWTVVLDAEPRSIVVFQPGVWGASSFGHVGWVQSVQQRSDGRYITFIEMNGTAGPYRWDTRTVKDVVGMSYILAP